MRNKFELAVLVVAILFSLLTTWSSASAPDAFAAQLGLKVMNAGGINEVRSQYSGFFFAVALVCLASLAQWLPRSVAFALLTTLFGGLIVGRIASLIANGGISGYGRTIVGLYAIDALGLALSATAYWFERSAAR